LRLGWKSGEGATAKDRVRVKGELQDFVGLGAFGFGHINEIELVKLAVSQGSLNHPP
jgi:hypothetical protein